MAAVRQGLLRPLVGQIAMLVTAELSTSASASACSGSPIIDALTAPLLHQGLRTWYATVIMRCSNAHAPEQPGSAIAAAAATAAAVANGHQPPQAPRFYTVRLTNPPSLSPLLWMSFWCEMQGNHDRGHASIEQAARELVGRPSIGRIMPLGLGQLGNYALTLELVSTFCYERRVALQIDVMNSGTDDDIVQLGWGATQWSTLTHRLHAPDVYLELCRFMHPCRAYALACHPQRDIVGHMIATIHGHPLPMFLNNVIDYEGLRCFATPQYANAHTLALHHLLRAHPHPQLWADVEHAYKLHIEPWCVAANTTSVAPHLLFAPEVVAALVAGSVLVPQPNALDAYTVSPLYNMHVFLRHILRLFMPSAEALLQMLQALDGATPLADCLALGRFAWLDMPFVLPSAHTPGFVSRGPEDDEAAAYTCSLDMIAAHGNTTLPALLEALPQRVGELYKHCLVLTHREAASPELCARLLTSWLATPGQRTLCLANLSLWHVMDLARVLVMWYLTTDNHKRPPSKLLLCSQSHTYDFGGRRTIAEALATIMADGGSDVLHQPWTSRAMLEDALRLQPRILSLAGAAMPTLQCRAGHFGQVTTREYYLHDLLVALLLPDDIDAYLQYHRMLHHVNDNMRLVRWNRDATITPEERTLLAANSNDLLFALDATVPIHWPTLALLRQCSRNPVLLAPPHGADLPAPPTPTPPPANDAPAVDSVVRLIFNMVSDERAALV
jgi:hypothetical protein